MFDACGFKLLPNEPIALLTQLAAEKALEGLGGASLYLVGMMGSGKSTVGRMLARALG